MSDFNQYNSPEAPIVPEKSQNAGNLTETMLRYLKDASPWLIFMGVLGFIGCGVLVLYSVIAIIGSLATYAFLSDELFNFPIWLLSPLYLVMGVVSFFPAFFTYNFGIKIRKYKFSNSDEDLENAFKNNKSLWKFNGILSIIFLAFIPVMIIILMIVGVAMATTGMYF
ncbi:MAG: hypothetical protein FWD47_05500 [Treponema sp.]|nr:hypothetical protein [Treponema sp.]